MVLAKRDGVMQETLSITRALVELKTLKNRVAKKTTDLRPLAILVGDKLPKDLKSKEDFIKSAKADYQSIRDLTTRRAKIKSAIVQSNAVTRVKVGGEELTVAEAIERKTAIESEKFLLMTLSRAYSDEVKAIEHHNDGLKTQLLKLLEATYSKSEATISKDDHDKVAVPFYANNEAKLLDPLELRILIQNLEEEIVQFESEVDVILAESNARTDITLT